MVSVLFADLVVEAVDEGDVSRLVISSEKDHFVRVFELVEEKKGDGLDWIVASINEVSYHDVPLIWQLSAFLEHLQYIKELSMNITT